MVIDPDAAQLFISNYKALLTEVHSFSKGKPDLKLLDMLAAARNAAVVEPSLIDRAISNLESAGFTLEEEVLTAIQSLKVQRWIYLRDTTKCSIFMEPECHDAYAVLGLNQRLCDIVGGTGVLILTGVFHFRRAYVCDGIVSGPIWLGSNYRREYSEKLASLRKSGHFHTG